MAIIVPVLTNFFSPGTLMDGKDYLLPCLSSENVIPNSSERTLGQKMVLFVIAWKSLIVTKKLAQVNDKY